ncbi:hypothetical protein WR25_12541 [Diploscapter pachys]|uniref:Metallo-beta-lactamase domain-containing protein n=1 Tax=Diploscapter pachys TaxID=2018661 RepID=A0A2A2JUL9_9BILA|nr:hypothetical protein WR25_12541 [Diploscapter pachys]
MGSRLRSSVSLVYDGGYFILVDTPSATDIEAKDLMLKDHFGQLNFFPNARHFFGAYEYSDDNYMTTELNLNETMKLSNNVYLMNTPGHTAQDVSVIVLNTPCCGTVVVSGDLFYNETDAMLDSGEWFEEAWNPVEGRNNRYKILCMADFIIPGHGKLFKVNSHMRRNANCATVNATNSLLIELKRQQTNEHNNIVNQFNSYSSNQQNSNGSMPPCNKNTFFQQPVPQLQTQATTTTTTTPIPKLSDEAVTPKLSIQWADDKPNTFNSLNGNSNNANNLARPNYQPNPSHQTFSSLAAQTYQARQSIAPVIETAAQQLSKLLNVQLNQKDPKDVPFPHTKFWQDTISKISMGQLQGKLTTGVVGNVPGGLSQAVLSAQFNPNPFRSFNYLNAAFNVSSPPSG